MMLGCLQVLIVQYGGDVFSTRPLSASQWAACIGIGSVSLLLRWALTFVPAPSVLSKPATSDDAASAKADD